MEKKHIIYSQILLIGLLNNTLLSCVQTGTKQLGMDQLVKLNTTAPSFNSTITQTISPKGLEQSVTTLSPFKSSEELDQLHKRVLKAIDKYSSLPSPDINHSDRNDSNSELKSYCSSITDHILITTINNDIKSNVSLNSLKKSINAVIALNKECGEKILISAFIDNRPDLVLYLIGKVELLSYTKADLISRSQQIFTDKKILYDIAKRVIAQGMNIGEIDNVTHQGIAVSIQGVPHPTTPFQHAFNRVLEENNLNDSIDMLNLFLEKGANLDLDWGTCYNCPSVSNFFLNKGSNVTPDWIASYAVQRMNLLIRSIQLQSVECVEFLIEKGANVNQKATFLSGEKVSILKYAKMFLNDKSYKKDKARSIIDKLILKGAKD